MTMLLGLDLGQRRDPSALAVVEERRVAVGFDYLHWMQENRREWVVRHLERWRLGTPYTEVVKRVAAVVGQLAGRGARCRMAVDATGVGAPVVDMLRAAGLKCELMPVLLTSGPEERSDGQTWFVPKVNVLAQMERMLEQEELRISRRMAESEALVRELMDFGVFQKRSTSALQK